ncbi:hypothetical protein [Pseudoduganella sp. HUAS MS19]
MSLEQMTAEQMDAYERLWTRMMLVSGASLIVALILVYVYWGDMTNMLACGTVSVASIVALSIAATKLRELERGLTESDREGRSDMHSALQGLDD